MDLCYCSGKQWSREELVLRWDSGLVKMATWENAALWKKPLARSNPVFLLSSPPQPIWLFEFCLRLSFWDFRIWKGKFGCVGCWQVCLSDFQWDKEATSLHPRCPLNWTILLRVLEVVRLGPPWELFFLGGSWGSTTKYISHCQIWVKLSFQELLCNPDVFLY